MAPVVAQATPEPEVRVYVRNPAGVGKREVVIAPVPFARGELAAPAADEAVRVAIRPAETPGGAAEESTGVPRLSWPDGSVAVLAVAVPAELEALAERTYVVGVVRDEKGAAQCVARRHTESPWPAEPPFATELVDPWGRVLGATLLADPTAGPAGVLRDDGHVRVVRLRGTHRLPADAAAGAGAPLLDARAYYTTFAGSRRAELTVLLDGHDPACGPLGPVRFTAFRLRSLDPEVRLLPAFAADQRIPSPMPREDRTLVQDLVADGQHYLGDGTAKAFRVHLFLDGPSLSGDDREVARWSAVRLFAVPDVDDLRRTRAWGAFGGPAPVLSQDQGDDRRRLDLWRANARRGLWGGYGDPEDARLGGAPRHGDSLLHDLVRWRSAPLAAVAEGMVLQHTLRPTGGRATRLPADTAPYRAGLQEHAKWAPHGYPRLDYEHVSACLLFDWWWITGDPLAQDELRRVGASARAMLGAVPFRTSRGEGRCLEAGALAAMATGDRELAAFLVEHARNATAKVMAEGEALVAIPQPPHVLVLGGGTPFDTTSQMAALVRGLAALHRATGEAALVPLVERVADAMADPAWQADEGPKTMVGAADRSRYSFAASPEDRSGSDRTLIGAFLVAAELATGAERVALLRQRAESLLQRELGPSPAVAVLRMAMANPWLQIAFDRRKQP